MIGFLSRHRLMDCILHKFESTINLILFTAQIIKWILCFKSCVKCNPTTILLCDGTTRTRSKQVIFKHSFLESPNNHPTLTLHHMWLPYQFIGIYCVSHKRKWLPWINIPLGINQTCLFQELGNPLLALEVIPLRLQLLIIPLSTL